MEKKTFKECCQEIATRHKIGTTLVTGHKASYWTEAAEMYASQYGKGIEVEFAEWIQINCSDIHDGFIPEKGKWFYYYKSGAIEQLSNKQLYEKFLKENPIALDKEGGKDYTTELKTVEAHSKDQARKQGWNDEFMERFIYPKQWESGMTWDTFVDICSQGIMPFIEYTIKNIKESKTSNP